MNITVKSNKEADRHRTFKLIVLVALLAMPCIALAQAQGLPYEGGLATFRDSMRGPVPFIISLAGIVGCGAMLIFGGEISGFLRTMVFIVLVVAVIVQANSVITMLGGSWTPPAEGAFVPSRAAGVSSPDYA